VEVKVYRTIATFLNPIRMSSGKCRYCEESSCTRMDNACLTSTYIVYIVESALYTSKTRPVLGHHLHELRPV
jgi:hypothetical protein